MHNSTLRNARGGLNIDTPLPELEQIEILQSRIDAANQMIFLGNLPTIIKLAKDMEARARAEVMEMVEKGL